MAVDGTAISMARPLVRLRAGDPPAATLALVAGVALVEAVAMLAPRPQTLSSNGRTT